MRLKLTLNCKKIKNYMHAGMVFSEKLGYSCFESVKQVIHILGRLNVKHLFMLRKIKFYRHLYLSENSCIICFLYL